MTVNIALRRQVDAAAAFHRGQCPARAAQRAGRLECRADPPVPGMVRQRARRQYRRRARGWSGARPAPSTRRSRRRPTRTISTSGWRASSATPSRCRRPRSPARSTAPPPRPRRRPRSTEGLAPLMGWVKRLADHVIQDRMGHADLEFAWARSAPGRPGRAGQDHRHLRPRRHLRGQRGARPARPRPASPAATRR